MYLMKYDFSFEENMTQVRKWFFVLSIVAHKLIRLGGKGNSNEKY